MVGTYGYARDAESVGIKTNTGLVGLFDGFLLFTVENYPNLQFDLQEISGGGGKTTFSILVSSASDTS